MRSIGPLFGSDPERVDDLCFLLLLLILLLLLLCPPSASRRREFLVCVKTWVIDSFRAATLLPSLTLITNYSSTFSAFMRSSASLFLPKCSGDHKYCPGPPARDQGSLVSGLVSFFLSVVIAFFPSLSLFLSSFYFFFSFFFVFFF